MKKEKVILTVYGAEERCASCVNAPGSKETYEWLQAAITRKYPDQPLEYRYVDIHQSQEEDSKDKEYIAQILDDELFYPLVTINEEVVDEGNPRLKNVYQVLENLGYQPHTES
ncbi:YuzD family protein [Halobacillus massiliensis]|uniref:YuzD family protein n=1 Tax=Halobacillus massiliensis TaxID=1926286 RepID=UPI0009E508A0|nr:YuzD family protein [Halobacillus massiliensis]